MPYHVHLEDSPFHSALKPLQLEVGTFKVAVPMLCGLVPKAPFSAVVTSSYSVAKGRGMRREGGGGGGEGRGGKGREGKGGRGRGGGKGRGEGEGDRRTSSNNIMFSTCFVR